MKYYKRYKTALVMLLIWTFLIAGSLTWNIVSSRENTLNQAREEVQTLFNKDLSFRLWAASHGGVYVPVSENQQPIPWLDHIEERDITTASGKQYTLVNPAAMLRQLSETFHERFGIEGGITSLEPINPVNAPDDWEVKQLTLFENGKAKSSWEIEHINGEPFLRYIQAMYTEQDCLRCHARQGYNVGDIRGGIGIKLSLSEYFNVLDQTTQRVSFSHFIIWLLGTTGIALYGRMHRQRAYERILRDKERQKDQQRVKHLAHHDVLTGLYNRHSLNERLIQVLENARKNQSEAAVLFIDLDRFKTINDSLGHPFGDRLLIEVAKQLSSITSDGDILARFGGDEFVLVRPALENHDELKELAQNIQNSVGIRYDIDNRRVESSASIGICIYPQDGENGSELLKNADIAMYHAKENGRNNYQFFTDSLSQDADERLELENLIRYGLSNNQFELHFQPILNSAQNSIECVETLVRWKHPEMGYIPPDKFIPIAEETGFIHELGDWILEEACKNFNTMKSKPCNVTRIAVNLSVNQLMSPSLIGKVEAVVNKYSLKPGELEFEITETAAMTDPDFAITQLSALNKLGITLTIDDFGTGYSSMSYLKQLPIQTLKLDRTFVRDIGLDKGNETICEATITLAHNLGLKVVAEGVETDEQLAFLRQRNCDYLQGYYFSKPLPVWELCEKFIHS